MKKQTICAVAAVLCAGSVLAGCSTSKPENANTTGAAVTDTTKETTAPAVTTEPTVVETTVPTTAATTAPTTVPTTAAATVPETTAAGEPTEPASASTASGKYVDLDNMQFTINGKTYTLGKTTLQDLINDGVPFREDDLANAGNNLNKNTQSQGFRIDLDEYWSAQVYVMNDTDGNKVTSECYVNQVYLPLKDDKTQNILTFAFPQDMTIDDLKANAGEPTDSRHYDGDDGYDTDTLEYTRESSKYIGDYGYTFEFMKGKLNYITIEYTP